MFVSDVKSTTRGPAILLLEKRFSDFGENWIFNQLSFGFLGKIHRNLESEKNLTKISPLIFFMSDKEVKARARCILMSKLVAP